MLKTLSWLLTGTVVAGTMAVLGFGGEGWALAETAADATEAVTNAGKAFYGAHNSCLRPVFNEIFVMKGGSPSVARVFAGYAKCSESYETDENGFMAFPEA